MNALDFLDQLEKKVIVAKREGLEFAPTSFPFSFDPVTDKPNNIKRETRQVGAGIEGNGIAQAQQRGALDLSALNTSLEEVIMAVRKAKEAARTAENNAFAVSEAAKAVIAKQNQKAKQKEAREALKAKQQAEKAQLHLAQLQQNNPGLSGLQRKPSEEGFPSAKLLQREPSEEGLPPAKPNKKGPPPPVLKKLKKLKDKNNEFVDDEAEEDNSEDPEDGEVKESKEAPAPPDAAGPHRKPRKRKQNPIIIEDTGEDGKVKEAPPNAAGPPPSAEAKPEMPSFKNHAEYLAFRREAGIAKGRGQ
jgi:hypothetical protein